MQCRLVQNPPNDQGAMQCTLALAALAYPSEVLMQCRLAPSVLACPSEVGTQCRLGRLGRTHPRRNVGAMECNIGLLLLVIHLHGCRLVHRQSFPVVRPGTLEWQ